MLAGVISSPIDADKAAYLSLDSLMTEVAYGEGMDLKALLGAFMAPREEDLGAGTDAVMAIQEKGLAAAESVVHARYQMLRQVYWYRTNRAIMTQVKFVIGSLLQAEAINFPDYFAQTLAKTEIEAARALAERFDELGDSIAVEGGTERKRHNPLHGILNGNRIVYKRILSIPFATDERFYRELASRGSQGQQLMELVNDVTETIERLLNAPNTIAVGEVLLDVPAKKRGELDGRVLVYTSHGDHYSLLDQGRRTNSPVLRAAQDEFEQYVKLCRVFVHPSIYCKLESRVAMGKVEQEVRDALLNRCSFTHRAT